MRKVVNLGSDPVAPAAEGPIADWWVTHCRPGRGETAGFPRWTARQAQEQRWAGFPAAGQEAVDTASGRWVKTREKWIEARVPGDVHLDLLRAGIIPEPMEGRNFADLEWVEQEEWWYLCSFNLAAEEVKLARAGGAELVFEGIDTEARIWLNGQPLGRVANMFRTFRFLVTDKLKTGENTLAVQVSAGLEGVHDKSLRRLARSWNQEDLRRLWLRRAQFGFGWDWAPRLASCGIWRPVRLELLEPIVLRNVHVQEVLPPGPLPADRPVPATVYLEAEVDSTLPGFTDVLVTASWTLLAKPGMPGSSESSAAGRPGAGDGDGDGNGDGSGRSQVFRRRLFPGRNRLGIRMQLPQVWPWWPRPLGTPFLYELKLTVTMPQAAGDGEATSGSATILDEVRLRYGFRRIELWQTPRPMVMPDTDEEVQGGPADEATTFTFFVNGVPVFAQGGNWVPADCLPARVTPEKYRFLLERAVDAGCNMLRVWGGGIYEHPIFYDLCDELGVLVWQEFMFACGYYPDFDAEFRAEVEAEAEEVVRRLRHHPCIAVWAGNNEIATMAWGHWKHGRPVDPEATVSHGSEGWPGLPAADVRSYPGQRLFEEVLAGVCARLDPGRPYLASSPMSLPGVEPDNPWQGDTHSWYPRVDYEKDYGRDPSGFCSEFGSIGPADVETLCQAVPALRLLAGQRPPADLAYGELLSRVPELREHVHPSEDAMVRRRLLAHFFGPGVRAVLLDGKAGDKGTGETELRVAGEALDRLPLADWVRLGQLMQAEVLRYAFGHYRRRLWDCSGSLMWMWDDAWPETGWTPVDYYGRPKALFFVLRRLFQPVSLVWRKVRRRGGGGTYDRVDWFELYGVNLLRRPVRGRLRYGWWGFHDREPQLVEATVEIPPLSSRCLGDPVTSPADPVQAAAGAVYAELEMGLGSDINSGIGIGTGMDDEIGAGAGGQPRWGLQAREFAVPWGELQLPAAPEIRPVVHNDQVGMVSDSFAWDVKVDGLPEVWRAGINGPARLPYDDHFDLFPGRVHWVVPVKVLEQAGGRGHDLKGTAINGLVRTVQEMLAGGRS